MKRYENMQFDEERALYGQDSIEVVNCRFDGPADGESAFKEGRNITVSDTYFNLRYPFWHDDNLTIRNSEMTELCRAALWYSHHVHIKNTKMHGIKALRECGDVIIENCDIVSPEFGWSTDTITMKDSSVQAEYFMMRSDRLHFDNVTLNGKYSFQYITDSVFENCNFDTKDAFWHAKNVTVRNSVIKGEYLGWYCENVTFENCVLTGTQPLCYCKGLKLINCEMRDTDLAFEKSDVEATVKGNVLSIKNPHSGTITVDSVNEIIMDDPKAEGKIIIRNNA
ncbi:MAG: DUF3737 family protein [Erysipelotrichaceae bacterium]|nr:DUF3737 family protein [Erysipelotrichaceae bacterium]